MRLSRGQTFSVPPKRPHLVTNAGDTSAVFLGAAGNWRVRFRATHLRHSDGQQFDSRVLWLGCPLTGRYLFLRLLEKDSDCSLQDIERVVDIVVIMPRHFLRRAYLELGDAKARTRGVIGSTSTSYSPLGSFTPFGMIFAFSLLIELPGWAAATLRSIRSFRRRGAGTRDFRGTGNMEFPA